MKKNGKTIKQNVPETSETLPLGWWPVINLIIVMGIPKPFL